MQSNMEISKTISNRISNQDFVYLIEDLACRLRVQWAIATYPNIAHLENQSLDSYSK